MAFEYNGKVYLNLEEQVEVNSKMAADAKEKAESAIAQINEIPVKKGEGAASMVGGYNTTAKGIAATCLGSCNEGDGDGVNKADGNVSFVAGYNSQADENAHYSAVFGMGGRAHGQAGLISGDGCETNGLNAVALGSKNKALANGSVALGGYNKNTGVDSIVCGNNLINSVPNCAVFGKYNYNNQNDLLQIGNGTASGRDNAFRVTKEGTVWVKNDIIAGTIKTCRDDQSEENMKDSIVRRTVTGQIIAATPTIDSAVTTKKYVDTNFAPKATNGYVEKKTATGTSQYVYGFTGSTQNTPQVSYAAITGSSIVSRNGGRIKCGAPDGTDNNHVVTLGYANDNYAPKATNGYVEKQTTTSGSWKAYVYNNTGDNSLLVMSGGDGTAAPTGTGIAATTGGKLRTNTPTGPYHAANKQYVDNLISSAVVDFNGSNIDTPTTEVGLKVYAAMQTFGFFVPAHTAGNSTIFTRPLTDSEVTIPANTFAFSAIQSTSTGLTDSYSTGLYYTVDSTGVITAVV